MGAEGAQRRDAVANRQAVIDAATGLLPLDPGAGMQEIADRSGLGRSTVYRHFPTREALFRALLREVIATSGEELEDLLRGQPDLAAGLCDVGDLLVRVGMRYRFLYSHRHEAAPMLNRVGHDPSTPLAEFLAVARGRGEVRSDLPIAWLVCQFIALTIALVGDVITGRVEREGADRLLGDTFIAMTVARA
ncbi:MAG: helix-turn-helix domain-containing protein [Solirubrobacterales bacterium]|nr:TetR/AcrR family transcriptional regulator [Solirubrobacterales bacterium]